MLKTKELTIKYEGQEMKLLYPDYADDSQRSCLSKGMFYEQNRLEEIRMFGKKGTYVDVGCNIGNHSLYFSKFCGAKSIYAIEGLKKFTEIYKENMKMNGIDFKINEVMLNKWNTLDMFIDFPVDVIKIDVEGAELEVVKGMDNTLGKYHPVLIIEMHNSQRDYHAIEDYLSEFGYNTIKKLSTAHYLFWCEATGDNKRAQTGGM